MLQVGKQYLFKDKLVTCTAKWAQGIYHTFVFSDGYSFNGDPEPLFKSGDLQNVVTKEVAIESHSSSIGDSAIVENHQHKHWQAPLSHPTQKEGREENRGKTPKS